MRMCLCVHEYSLSKNNYFIEYKIKMYKCEKHLTPRADAYTRVDLHITDCMCVCTEGGKVTTQKEN